MEAFVSGKKRIVNHDVTSWLSENFRGEPLIPGLSDDVAKHCLALVPRASFPAMGSVCKKWRFVVLSKEFIIVRRLAGMLEEWLYVLTTNVRENESHWDVMDCLGRKLSSLPPMPGPMKTRFKVAVVDGKLLVIAGCSMISCSQVDLLMCISMILVSTAGVD